MADTEVEEIDGELVQVEMEKNEVIREVEAEAIVENVMVEQIDEVTAVATLVVGVP